MIADTIIPTGMSVETPTQPNLIPAVRPEPVLVTYPLDRLPPDSALYGDPAAAALVTSIHQVGVMEPILLVSNGPEQNPTLAAGRRRVRAARAAGLTHIPALIYPEGTVLPAVLSLWENLHRSSNTVSDYQAVEALATQGHSVETISATLKVSKSHVQRLLLFRRLIPALRDGLLAGQIRASIAECIARLTATQQEQLLPTLAAKGKVTWPDVQKVIKVQHQQQALALPDDVFATPDAEPGQGATAQLQQAPPWQLQASTLLAQALDLVPSEQEALRAALAQAAALVSA